MNVRSLCLAILNMGNATGYEIRKLSTDAEYSYFVDASFGSIYPALTKLDNDGLVTCSLQAQEGRPARKVYSITEAGRADFRLALRIPPQKDLFKSEFLLLALNVGLIDRDVLQTAIDQRFDYLQEELEIIELACADKGPDSALFQWVGGYGRACLLASVQYLEENKDQLLAMAGQNEPHQYAAE